MKRVKGWKKRTKERTNRQIMGDPFLLKLRDKRFQIEKEKERGREEKEKEKLSIYTSPLPPFILSLTFSIFPLSITIPKLRNSLHPFQLLFKLLLLLLRRRSIHGPTATALSWRSPTTLGLLGLRNSPPSIVILLLLPLFLSFILLA